MAQQNNIAEIEKISSPAFMANLENYDFLIGEIIEKWKGLVSKDEKVRFSSIGFILGMYVSYISKHKAYDLRDELLTLHLVGQLVMTES